jgi:glycosyltransferase involved in cell wall biosynthesis
MRIGIDARPLGGRRTGIGNYVHGLVQLLPQAAPEHEYFLYSSKQIDSELHGPSIHRQTEHAFASCPGTVWFLARGARLSRRDRLDIFWATTPILPIHMPKHLLKVVTVYDLVWRHFPETMSRYTLFIHRMFAEEVIHRADLVVTISQSTAEDIIQFLGVPPEKIKLVYPGVSEHYKPHDPFDAAKYISEKYNVSPRYMAAVGTLEPRKNLALAVDVLRILKQNGGFDGPLLVAGGCGWRNSKLFERIRLLGLTERDIRFLGYLPDEDLPLLYAGAQVFLFPSLYEGFGLPPLEAMACGTPVIASNAKCMPEVLGDAAVLEPANSAEKFAAAVTRVLSDESLRQSLRVAGIEQARKFRWEKSVEQLLEAFEGSASPGQIPAGGAMPSGERPERYTSLDYL